MQNKPYLVTKNVHSVHVEQTVELDTHDIIVYIVYVEYVGGGECWEYTIYHDGKGYSTQLGIGSRDYAMLYAMRHADRIINQGASALALEDKDSHHAE